jgi:hypothetical protein
VLLFYSALAHAQTLTIIITMLDALSLSVSLQRILASMLANQKMDDIETATLRAPPETRQPEIDAWLKNARRLQSRRYVELPLPEMQQSLADIRPVIEGCSAANKRVRAWHRRVAETQYDESQRLEAEIRATAAERKRVEGNSVTLRGR